MSSVHITTDGNIVNDPELSYTNSGVPVANFRLAVNRREWDQNSRQWVDGSPTYLRCTVWKGMAENVANSLRKGDSVLVVGDLKQQNWEDREGNRRTSYDVEVKNIGASLKFAEVTINRTGGGQRDGFTPESGFGSGDENVPF